MINSEVWNGVQALLTQYAAVDADDFVLLLYTADSLESASWISAALELRKIQFARVCMAPLRDEGLADRLDRVLPPPTELEGRLVLLTIERDTMSHTGLLERALAPYESQSCAAVRIISASAELFSRGLRATPEQLSARNATILDRCLNARQLRITTRGGTHLSVELDNQRHRWISNRGMSRAGRAVILPPGEVATFPAGISGVHVADFAFNINTVTNRDARLHDPVTLWIENGRVTRFACDHASTYSFIEACLGANCAFNVGELGFGTNPHIDQAVALNSHLNERRPGVHLGLGQHNQGPGVVGYQCPLHLDLIAVGGLIWADNDSSPIDLENLVPSVNPHPSGPWDEDVFSPSQERQRLESDDCCGISAEGDFQFSCPQ